MSGRHRVMKAVFKRGAWTHEEDMKLVTYINRYGIWNWTHIPKHAGLSRTGRSCRLRWVNYLNPNVKRGNFTEEEDDFVIKMIQTMGTKWSAIAASLPGRTDNELKNRWHTHLKKRSESNNKLVQRMESQKDTISTSDYSSQEESVEASKHGILLSAPEASKPEEYEFPISMSPDISNIDGASSSLTPTLGGNNIIQDTLETIGDPDPHIRFWREPYSLDHMYMENHHASAYVNPGFELPSPESTLGSHNYDYRFDILSVENQFDGMNDPNVYI